MKQITLPIRKEKINKRNLIIALPIVLLLVVGGGYIFFQKAGKVPEFNLGPYLQRLAAGLIAITERETKQEEIKPEELKIILPASSPKIYEETAETGEGITHLARKALKEYLKEKGGQDLTPEHKIYIEDYLQKKTGERWLNLGERVTFSEELIKEAIEKSLQLSQEQLENLKQYSALVQPL